VARNVGTVQGVGYSCAGVQVRGPADRGVSRMRMHKLWIAAVAILAVVLAAGCSSSSSKDKTPTSAPSDGAQPTAAATSSGGGSQATAAATSASNGASSGADVPDIKEITQKFAKATFHASYKVTGGGALGGGEMQLYKQGQDRFRFDITATENGQEMSIIFIQNGATSAFCLNDAGELAPFLGVDAGSGVCFKSNPDDPNNPVGDLSTTFSDIENADVTVLDTSTRKVAGRDTSCYRAKDNAAGDIQTICFDDAGAMMYVETEGADATTLEATDVKSSVDDKSFDLPYEVKDFPGFGG